MRLSVLAALVVSCAVYAAPSQAEPISERQAIYKSFGRVSREPGQMLQGKAPFELAKVKEALTTYIDGSRRLPALFPEDSKVGFETEALPAIWEDKPRFEALLSKLNADSSAALASITDEASFKSEFPKVLGDCGTCHKSFRAKK